MITSLDHIVLTCASVEATARFYAEALGFRIETQDGRTALHFGNHKINLHQVGHEFTPHARVPAPGTGDFCLISDEPVEAAKARLEQLGIRIEEGPVARTGARGALLSIYFRDPDGNLVEVANEVGADRPT
ncbi:VOC family protein [uncultured Enterovirga sp.]|uniref:VOC family protein n=1 Tax=uncultured Enterovirga sp. TaxID=2026352 RepID=UPI0035CB13D9